MKRLIFTLLASGAVWAQANREVYRVPFEAWRQAEPDLERTAGDPSPGFQAQTDRSAGAMQTYLKARQSFLAGLVRTEEQAQWAGRPFAGNVLPLEVRPDVQRMLTTATEQLSASITTFGTVRDAAIQQVRQAMERERAALNALNESMNTRTAALRDLTNASEEAELLRAATGQNLGVASAGRARIAAHVDREAAAWTAYYKTLVEGAMSTDPGPERAPGATGAANAPAAVKPPVARPSPAGLPLSRYTGTWVFQDKAIFFGAQPDTVELVVTEEAGRMAGTLSARFVLPAGSPGDPVLKLEFQGLVQQTRNQSFPLRTAEGAGGTIELIPGTAFNLLEVNLQTEPQANKVRSANFVLLKR